MSLRPSDLSFTYCLHKTPNCFVSGKGHISIPHAATLPYLPPGKVRLACVPPKLPWVASRPLGISPFTPPPILNGLYLLMAPLLLLDMIIGNAAQCHFLSGSSWCRLGSFRFLEALQVEDPDHPGTELRTDVRQGLG